MMACDYMTLELLDRQLRELDSFFVRVVNECQRHMRICALKSVWFETPHEIPQETAFFGNTAIRRIQELCAKAVINVCTNNPSFLYIFYSKYYLLATFDGTRLSSWNDLQL